MATHRARIKTDHGDMTAAQLGVTPPANAAALAFTPAGTIAATTVQAAIEEVASEAGGGGSSLTVADEGSDLTTAATTLDFVGAGVTASGTGTTKTITIPGGGGSSSGVLLDYTAPALTSGSPTPITTNTTADQTLLGGLTVTGAAAGDLLEIPFSFDAMNNSAGTVSTVWRVKIGGVTAWTSASVNVGNNSTNRYMASGQLTILVATTTDLRMSFDLAYTVASGTDRIKGWNTGFGMTGSGVSTESLATTKDIDISLQLGTASAAIEFRPIFAALKRTRA